MATRTALLGHQQLTVTGTNVTLLTVPPGRTALVKDIRIGSGLDAVERVRVLLLNASGTVSGPLWIVDVPGQATVDQRGCFLVLPEGYKLQARTAVTTARPAGTVSNQIVTVHGALLDGVTAF